MTQDLSNLAFSHPTQNLVIEAAPGCGKTTFAADRCKGLLFYADDPINPDQILVISFSRAAVAVTKSRLRDYSINFPGCENIFCITTDSLIGFVISMATANGLDLGYYSGYEGRAECLYEHTRGDYGQPSKDFVIDFFGSKYKHIVIDEAQDIWTAKKNWLLSLIRVFSGSIGFTVLGDRYQEIYNWEDNDETSLLADIIEGTLSMGFISATLRKSHRFLNEGLKDKVEGFRELLEIQDLASFKEKLISNPINLSNGLTHIGASAIPATDEVYLFRANIDCLAEFLRLKSRRVSCALALKAASKYYHPVLGILFSGLQDQVIDSVTLYHLALGKIDILQKLGPFDADMVVNMIIGDQGQFDISDVHLVLARHEESLVMDRIGKSLRVFGSIHSYKGREANTVNLVIPKWFARQVKTDQKAALVYYVGASRARHTLNTLILDTERYDYSERGRAYKTCGSKCTMEFGSSNDYEVDLEQCERTHGTIGAYMDYLGSKSFSNMNVIARRRSEKEPLLDLLSSEHRKYLATVSENFILDVRTVFPGFPFPLGFNGILYLGSRTVISNGSQQDNCRRIRPSDFIENRNSCSDDLRIQLFPILRGVVDLKW